MKEKCDKCGGDLEPIIVTGLDQSVKKHRICKRCKVVYKEGEQKETENILDNCYVKKGSKAWYKLKKWGLIPGTGSPYGPDYNTFMLSVKGRLMIIQELELMKLEILKLKLKIGEKP